MSKIKNKKPKLPKKTVKTFTSQAYPLYVWGMWAQVVRDTNPATDFKILGYKYHKDRLTVVGWMQLSDTRVEPMVFTTEWGVVPVYELTGAWPAAFGELPDYYDFIRDSEDIHLVVPHEEFVLVDIAMSEPDQEMFDVNKRVHLLNSSAGAGMEVGSLKDLSNLTVVDEAGDE
jgi:hypothetical protein